MGELAAEQQLHAEGREHADREPDDVRAGAREQRARVAPSPRRPSRAVARAIRGSPARAGAPRPRAAPRRRTPPPRARRGPPAGAASGATPAAAAMSAGEVGERDLGAVGRPRARPGGDVDALGAVVAGEPVRRLDHLPRVGERVERRGLEQQVGGAVEVRAGEHLLAGHGAPDRPLAGVGIGEPLERGGELGADALVVVGRAPCPRARGRAGRARRPRRSRRRSCRRASAPSRSAPSARPPCRAGRAGRRRRGRASAPGPRRAARSAPSRGPGAGSRAPRAPGSCSAPGCTAGGRGRT